MARTIASVDRQYEAFGRETASISDGGLANCVMSATDTQL